MQALIESREENEILASRLKIYEAKRDGDIQVKVFNWRGADYLDFVKIHYRNAHGESSTAPHASDRFSGSKISKFYSDNHIDENVYYEYVLYLLCDDP